LSALFPISRATLGRGSGAHGQLFGGKNHAPAFLKDGKFRPPGKSVLETSLSKSFSQGLKLPASYAAEGRRSG